ncbi:MAG: BTAD domain-containing putative transcriptional regulator [Actinomycetota bacterium]
MRFQVLGGLGVVDPEGRPVDVGGPKQRAVLASLLVARGRPVAADRLQEHVWGEAAPANPETSLQAYVSNLRRVLEPGRRPREAARLLITQPSGYALLADPGKVDLTRFEDAVERGQALLAKGDLDTAREELQRALDEWRGPLLPELAGLPWVDEHAAWLEDLHRQAVLARIEAGLALGEHGSLLPRIVRAVAEHPFEERLRAQLALALYRSGRQRDALAALDDARRTLREEVGIDPGPELRELEAKVLAQDPSLQLSGPPIAARPPSTDDRRSGAPWTDSAPRPQRRADDAPGTPDVGIFVGRRQELDALLTVAATAATSGRPVVISGEPGIGKTRLVEELVARMPATTVVAWGRCTEHASLAGYWPVIQVGRQLEGAGVLPADLASELLPESDVQEVPGEDAIADRFGLHVAVVEALAAATGPTVIVVDDLQWADAASLRVIEFLAGELRRTRALLVVTTRPVGADAPAPLIECLGELARQPGAMRCELTGLSDAAVQDWVAERTARPADPELSRVIRDRTEGNPFFVGELVELLTTEGRSADLDALRRGAAVPRAVKDVVRRRVSRLPASSQTLLSAASVIGRTFDLDVLATVVEREVPVALDDLEAALEVGLVDDTDVPGRFEFSHAIVADTLSEEITPARRARLHAATARALERLRAADLDGHLSELAHHAVEGAIAGTADAAYEWSVRAARQATQRLAHEEAAEHWAQAVRALELARPEDRTARFEAMREEGLAWLRVDDVDHGYAAMIRALDLALALGDLDRVATVAAEMHIDGVWNTGEVALGGSDPVSSLERALAALPDEPTRERVLATGALAEAAYWVRPPELLEQLPARAVADARTLDEPATLGRTLHKRDQALWRASTFEPRAEAAQELFAMAESGGLPPALEAIARFGMAGVSWDRAEVPFALEQARLAQELSHRIASPALMTQTDWFMASLLGFQGHLADAEALCDRAYELYRRTRRWSAESLDAGLRLTIYLEQDRPADIEARRDDLLDSPYRPWFQEGYAYGLVELGRTDEAADLLADAPLPPLIDCWMFLGLVGAAIHTRAALDEVEAVRTLVDVLAPYAGRLCTTGTGSAFGDVHLALAAGHRALGDREVARHHAHASVALLAAAGAGPDLVRALLLRAELDPASAAHDLDRAAELVEGLDLPLLRRRLASLG